MANYSDRYPDNTAGIFYVDQDCIACDTCVDHAPKHFTLTQNNDHAIVIVQPQSEAETANCQAALDACPVDAIGNDGVQTC